MPSLDELRTIRLQKIQSLKDLGINPYPAQTSRDTNNGDILADFGAYEGKKVVIAGRLMSYREHGAIAFANIQDYSANIQLFIKKDVLVPTSAETQTIGFSDLSLLDIGDFVEAHGKVTKTSTGQISVLVSEIHILTKAIRPLPDKHDGLKDPEIIFRRRYLDLTMNPDRRKLFERKSKFWEACRQFMKDHEFIEVETPVLEHVTGGADARPFVTFMNALSQDYFLRISTELYQKRLIGGGFEKVYTIGPNFRNEGISDEHLPEYYQLEWYWAYADYRNNMKLVQELFQYIALQVYGKTVFQKNEHTFDLAAEWQELDYSKIIFEKLGVDIFSDSDEKMATVLKEKGIVLEGAVNRNRLIDNLWKIIRKTISGPAFLINEPKFMSPLAKSSPQAPELTERFHVIIAGSELGNGYSELNDPIDQLERFKAQQDQRDSGDEEAQMLDIDFVEMLEFGMPPTSGYGQSERVFWFLENVTAREGTLFPHLRHTLSDETTKIYGISETKISSSHKDIVTKEPLPDGLSKEIALTLLNSHITNENLKRHCQAVGFVMRALAAKLGGNEDVWEVLGILHDSDWEKTQNTPELHTTQTIKWLSEIGITEGPIVKALMSHNRKLTKLAEIDGLMEWSLETCDELTGFIVAVALTRPDKKLSSVTVESVQKKWKAKEFAKAVDRAHIEQCESKLGIPLNEFIAIALNAMQLHADEIGL